jgi:hypothetical protein
MANTTGEKELKTDWDEHENIGKQMHLIPEISLVPERKKVGL